MNKIWAGQFIYSRVDRDRSPNRRDGLQTIFYTRDRLTQKEVGEIEPRLLYYAGDTQPVKRVFFYTSTGKAVVAQIVPLAETDSAGRGGMYLAHGLVFDGSDFESAGASPFGVFNSFPFLSALDEAFARGDLKTGNIAAAECIFSPGDDRQHELSAAAKWPAEEFQKLATVALAAGQLAEKRSAVFFVGPVPQVQEALAAALIAVPTRQRCGCSFDTYFHKCNLVSTYFWAVGQDRVPPNPNFIVVDVVKNALDGDCPEMDTCYGRWLNRMITSESLATVADHRDSAQALGDMIEGKAFDEGLARAAPDKVVATMCEANPKQYQQHVFKMLVRVLHSKLLARRAFPFVTSDEKHRLAVLWGISFLDLVKILLRSFRKDNYKVLENERPEFEVIVGMARRELTSHEVVVWLELMVACYRGDTINVKDRLSRLNQEWYVDFVSRALISRIIHPATLLLPGRGDIFFVGLEKSQEVLQEQDIVPITQVLLANGDVHCLEQILPYVHGLSKNTLKALEQAVLQPLQALSNFYKTVQKTKEAIRQPDAMRNQ